MQRIIYLPGWLNPAENLRPLAELSGGDFELLDLPDDLARSVPDFADWVASRITEPVWLAGHSFGGKVAVAVAALHPEKVKGIAVIAGSNRGRLIFRLLRPAVKLAKFLGFSGKRFRA
ncbi:MAG: alpha/beta hydrolase, partial [Rickettsiales bacterium]|nr:alpha/beta hydrolase [Rickettsiales bacterium]